MTDTRFHCKTKNTGITIMFSVIVMLLLLSASCGKESKEIVEVVFDPETTYTMRALDISSLISDSGVTRYRMNTKEWLVYGKAKEPFWYFPQGIFVEKFDTLFNSQATIKADTAYYWEKETLWKLVSNVEILNLKGERFETSLLYWKEKADSIWTDQFISVFPLDGTVKTGVGFVSNQDMTEYEFYKLGGDFIFTESPATPDSTQVKD